MAERGASRTAVLVCQGRAVAHDRLAVGRFEDPTAMALLRDDERGPVERARADGPPKGWAARMDFEMLGRQAEAMAARTVAVDDAVRAAGHPQLVVVGAGLDGRAWRLADLADVDVFEVDHPASQADKCDRAATLTLVAGSLQFVPVDLVEDRLDDALASRGHVADQPTTWVLEGVIPYLTEADAAATLVAIAGRSAPSSRVVVTYQLPSQGAALVRSVARVAMVLLRRGDPMADEPRRSNWTPESVKEVVGAAGFELVEDIRLAALAEELEVPARHVGGSRVAVAELPAR